MSENATSPPPRKSWFEERWGPSWATTLWGRITVVAVAVTINPTIFGFLPSSWQSTIQGVAGAIAFLSGNKFAGLTKAANVSGTPATGVVIESKDGTVRDLPPEPPKSTT